MSIRGDESNYKWRVLALAALTHTFAVAMPTMCMPVLFKEISEELGLDLVQIGAVWGAAALTGMFSGLISGTLGDRFGVRRTLSIACLLAGLAGASRGLSNSFVSLSLTVLLSGFMFLTIPTNVHKACGLWFSTRRLGLANGVVSMGMALGFTAASIISATYLSPWLGGWRNVLFLYGAISVALSIPWRFVRDAPGDTERDSSDVEGGAERKTLSQVIRLRNVWLLGVAMMGLGGCIQGTLGYLPLYLREIGWSAATADRALATFHGASMLFVIPLASFSDRMGSRKTILMVANMMIAGGIALLAVADGVLVWVAVVIAGVFRDGFMAVLMTAIIEVDGVGPERAGTAVGMVMVLSQIGSLLSPAIGNSLAATGLSLPFAFWASLAVLALIIFSTLREGRTGQGGHRPDIKLERELAH